MKKERAGVVHQLARPRELLLEIWITQLRKVRISICEESGLEIWKNVIDLRCILLANLLQISVIAENMLENDLK